MANGPYDFGDMPETACQIALTGYQELEKGNHRQIVDRAFEREIVQAYLACISYTDWNVGRVPDALRDSPQAGNTMSSSDPTTDGA